MGYLLYVKLLDTSVEMVLLAFKPKVGPRLLLKAWKWDKHETFPATSAEVLPS